MGQQQTPQHFTYSQRTPGRPPESVHEITINRADEGDTAVVLSTTDGGPGAVSMSPENARRFAYAVLNAADVIEGREPLPEFVLDALAAEGNDRATAARIVYGWYEAERQTLERQG